MILWIMNAAFVSKCMQAPNQPRPTDAGIASLTRSLMDTSGAKLHCPDCNAEIDFSQDIEWLGPTAFICKQCERIIELHRIVDL